MSFDVLVANPGRLRILTALAAEPRQEFVRLRSVTQLTDGNLSTHARRLAGGGLIDIRKSFHNGRPVTHIDLTPTGREALATHANNVLAALSGQPPIMLETARDPHTAEPYDATADDDWID